MSADAVFPAPLGPAPLGAPPLELPPVSAPPEPRAEDEGEQAQGGSSRKDALPTSVAAPSREPATAAQRAPLPPAAPVAPDEAEATSPALAMIELIVRSPSRFLDELEGPDLVGKVRTMLLTVAVAAGAFGAVVGAYRGGVQVAYAAVKMPLLLIGTQVVCAPAFVAIARAMGTRVPPRQVVAVALGACARYALVLSGLSPLVWLLEGWLGYHGVALCITACCAVAGVAASQLLFRGLSRKTGAGALAGLAFVAVHAVVGAQTSWLLRPFLVRPKTEHVPFVRPLEGDLFGSVGLSARSAAGIYDEPRRDPPGKGAPEASP